MKIIIVKLLKDFWLSKGKLFLCILAACLSGWGISTVVYSYMMAERDFEVNFARTYPADFEIVIDDYSPALREAFLNHENVSDLERREILGARAKVREDRWMPLRIFAVEDIQNMRMDVFQILEETSQEPKKLFIETNAAIFLGPSQDTLDIQFPGNIRETWAISGKTHDGRLAPSRMERVIYTQATSIEMIEKYLTPGRQRFLVKTDVSSDRAELQRVSNELSDIASDLGSNIVYVQIPEPGKHMHQNIVDGISFLQESTGITISIMGIVLLSLILLTWVFPQIGDVGIMKAIGASSERIFYSYCLVLSMVIFLGLMIGMPLGYVTALLFNKLIAFVQNFIPVEELLPLPVHIYTLLIGIIIPFAFGVRPLYRASRTTVHQAVNKTFYVTAIGVFKFFQKLISNSYLRYGVNNLFRNSTRSMLMSLLIATGVALYFTGSNFEYSINTELNNFADEANYAVQMRFSEDMTLNEVKFLEELPFLEQISPMRNITVSYRPPKASFVETRSVRVLSTKHILEESFVLKGKVDKNCKACLYISGEGMKDEFRDSEIGDFVILTLRSGEEKRYRYSGILKDMAAIGSPFFAFDDSEVENFNSLAFKISPEVSSFEATTRIDDALLNNDIEVSSIMNVDSRLASLEGHIEPTYIIIRIVSIFTIFIGLLSLLIVLNLTIQERTREVGILKSLGGSLSKVSGVFQREFLLVNLSSILFGILIATPLTRALCKVFGETVIYHEIPPIFDIKYMIVTSLAILVIQSLVIAIFNQSKLNRNARDLLDYNF